MFIMKSSVCGAVDREYSSAIVRYRKLLALCMY